MAGFEVRDLKESFGSEIIGFDPETHWDDESRRLIRETFDTRGALVFRDVDIDFEFQDRLCRMLVGDDGPGSTATRKEMRVSNKEEDGFAPNGRLMYHADMMWHPDQQFRVLSLYAVNVEPGSAKTQLANSAVGWQTLPADLRAKLEGRHARHQTGQVYHRGGDDLARPERTQEVSTVKPLPNPHPYTGQPLLYASMQMTHDIVELPADESEAVLTEVFDHLYSPELVYEHEWSNGDLLVFDNITMQHARGNVDYDGPTRTLRKCIAPIPNIKAEKPRYVRPS